MDRSDRATPLAIYPLSPTQEGMLFHTLYAPGAGIYLEQRWCLLHGALDEHAFREAWQQVVNRHDALRSAFHWRELERPMQVLYAEVELPFETGDWSQLAAGEQHVRLEAYLASDRAHGFVLDQAPLMRCALFRMGTELHQFVWTYHHLLMDGWCNGVLIGEVLQVYAALRSGAQVALAPVQPYRAFIDWLQTRDAAAAERYWREALRGAPVPTPLGLDRGAAGDRPERFAQAEHALAPELVRALEAYARSARLTLNTLMQAAWALWLARASGSGDVVFGTVLANRPPELTGAEQTVGLFINTVPVRVCVDDASGVREWLRALQDAQRAREAHGHVALADLQRWSGVAGGRSLFDSILVFENYPLSMAAAVAGAGSGLTLSAAGGYERTHYPLALMVVPEAGADGERRLRLCLRYDAARIVPAGAARLLPQIETLLRRLIAPDAATLGAIHPVEAQENERQRALGRGPRVVPTLTVPASIAGQARVRADGIALTFIGDIAHGATLSLTYAELASQVSRLAQRLMRAGVNRGARVGVCVPRSPQLPIALLAVLECGAAYVPLDPEYPRERLAFIARDAGLALALVRGDPGALPPGLPVLDVEADADEADGPASLLDRAAPGFGDLAYILYTSGSTGTPKGVAISHGSLASFLASMAEAPGLGAGDRLLAVTTIAFDIAALELLLPLVCGAHLVLTTAAVVRDGRRLAALLDERAITVMQATPATWRLLQAAGWPGSRGLKALCGGEGLDGALAAWLLDHAGEVWNMYGPTETTIWSAALRLEPRHLSGGGIAPVGGAIANTSLRVLDHALRPLPAGMPGELCIGGAGLAVGYVGRPGLTAAAFVPDPDSRAGALLYRSGDRARLREDGLFDLLGRADNQIKLRGYRIEPGEIEAVLAGCADVAQAVVSLSTADAENPQLVAHLTLASGVDREPALTRVREAAQARLPAYMVPSAWIVLAAMPLTPNGKVDRRALPALAPAAPAASSASASAAPRALDAWQEMVAGVWAEVLGEGRVTGPDDDFFALGGHSLPATRVIARMDELYGVTVPLRALFEHPRLADFAAIARPEGAAAAAGRGAAIARIPRRGPLPVSSAQRRQWLLARLDPISSAYTIPIALRLRGALSVAALQWSLEMLVARHESLRVAFQEASEAPCIVACEVLEVALPLLDLTAAAPGAREQALERALREEARQPFDLTRAPLWRARLYCLAPDQHVLALSLHHAIADDWSLGILVRELSMLYRSACNGERRSDLLAPLPLQYADYAAWEAGRDWGALTPALDDLRDLPPPLELPRRQSAGAEPLAGRSVFRIDGELTASLRRLGRSQGATLFMTLLAGFGLLLGRYSGSRDLVIGSPMANRGQAELQGIVGLFVNTLPIRCDLSGHPSVAALLRRMRAQTLAAYERQAVPLEWLAERVPSLRDRHGQVIQVLFALQSAPLDALELTGLDWSPIALPHERPKFELSLSVREVQPPPDLQVGRPQAGPELECVLEYRADLFEPALMDGMGPHYRRLLARMTAQADAPIDALAMLSAAELAALEALGSGRDCPLDGTVHAAFSRCAAAAPAAIALIAGKQRCSYGELERRANRLAQHLRALGVRAETPVGLWAERSLEAVVMMLAVLKAGGYFVPLDPQTPAARLARIVGAAGLRLVLTRRAGSVRLGEAAVVELALEAIEPRLEAIEPGLPACELPPVAEVGAEHPVYAMFTSGSTGQPKGVLAAHRAVLRLALAADYVSLGPATVMLHAAPLAFDASTFEIWGALLNGGRLVVLEEAAMTAAGIAAAVVEHRVDTLWLTAGLLNLVVDEQLAALAGVRQLVAGGDVLSVRHVSALRRAYPEMRIVNGYGPTEATTFACCHVVHGDDLVRPALPIGRPIAATRVYVLDADMLPVPVGVTGELYIGGAGLARGYLNRPDLTAERFLPNPFLEPSAGAGDDHAQTLYRTGDRVRQRADGVIEYLGRWDTQIKIRGFRIEPAEVERCLRAHPGVRDAVVGAVSIDGAKRLVAWLVGDGELPASDAWRQMLAAALPDYMLPSAYVRLPSLPLTASGKPDRRALPPPAAPSEATPAPDTDLERALRDIWATLLPGEIGRTSNFFHLGGDSIVAMQVVSRAHELGLALTPAQIFEHQTIAGLAAAVASAPAAARWIEAPQWPTGAVPLTPIQQWFFAQDLAQPSHFNQAVALRLPHVDFDTVERATAAAMARHDALRLRFRREAGRWTQTYTDEAVDARFERIDLSSRDGPAQRTAFEARAERLQSGLDIERGPLVRAACFDLGPREGTLLFIVIHHLVIDGVSWRSLLTDMHAAWLRLAAGRPIELGAKPHSFQQWAGALHGMRVTPQAEAYWSALAHTGVCRLPVEGRGGANLEADSASIHGRLDAPAAHALARAGPHTVQDALLAALLHAFGQWTGQRALWLDLEAHGRRHAVGEGMRFERTLGWFTNLYPVRLTLPAQATRRGNLRAVADQLNAVPDAGLSYGVLRYLRGRDDLALHPDLSFNYLGRVDLPGAGEGIRRDVAPGRSRHPGNARSHLIAVVCVASADGLSIEWTYSTRHHGAERIAALARAVERELMAIIAECGEAADEHPLGAHDGPAPEGIADEALAAAMEQVDFTANH